MGISFYFMVGVMITYVMWDSNAVGDEAAAAGIYPSHSILFARIHTSRPTYLSVFLTVSPGL
jgi:hypothetical protein